jgi:hypothetical protein
MPLQSDSHLALICTSMYIHVCFEQNFSKINLEFSKVQKTESVCHNLFYENKASVNIQYEHYFIGLLTKKKNNHPKCIFRI